MWVETSAGRASGDTEGRSHLGVRNQLGLLCLEPLCRRKRRLLQTSGPSGAGHVRVDDHVARDHASLDELEHREVLGRYEVDAVHLQGACGGISQYSSITLTITRVVSSRPQWKGS